MSAGLRRGRWAPYLAGLLVVGVLGCATPPRERPPEASGAAALDPVPLDPVPLDPISLGQGRERPAGPVVDELAPGVDPQAASLRSGDVLVEWSRSPRPEATRGGALTDPFDVIRVDLAEAPRGGVELVVLRDGRRQRLEPGPEEWGFRVRPSLPEPDAGRYLEALERSHEEDDAGAAAILIELAQAARTRSEPRLAAWLELSAATASGGALDWPAAEAHAAAARTDLASVEDVFPLSWVEESAARWRRRAQDFDGAFDALANAESLRRSIPGLELAVARAIEIRGEVGYARRDLELAEASFRDALEIVEAEAPESLVVARMQNQLGKALASRGRVEEAEDLFEAAVRIRRRLAPGTLAEAHSFNSLGILRLMRGDLAGGEVALRQSLTLLERLDPDGSNVGVALHNLGFVAAERGDLVAGEEYYRRALARAEAAEPGGMGSSLTLNNLGTIARRRGDVEGAQEYHRRALAIRERIAPGGLDVAVSLVNLALLAVDRGQLDVADEMLRRSLAIRREQAPDSLDVAQSEANQCRLQILEEAFDEARASCRRAEDLYRRLAPEGLWLAAVWRNFGEIAAAEERPEEAERWLRKAKERLDRVLPETEEQAMVDYELGRALRAQGRRAEAVVVLEAAVAALDAQRGKIGGSPETQALASAQTHDVYRELVDLEAELGKVGKAFDVLERSRARSLLALLAQRDLAFPLDLDPELDRRRRRLAVEYDRAQAELAQLAAVGRIEDAEQALAEVRRLRLEQEEVRREIRRAAPRVAELGDPRSVDLGTALDLLDDGTLVLDYSVGAERSWLFLLAKGSAPRVVALAFSEAELRAWVERFLLAVETPGTGSAAVEAAGEELYRRLVAPAEAQIELASRLLVVPDGPLHGLPFAALLRPAGGEGLPAAERYLVARRPLHTVLSLSLYRQLAEDGPAVTDGAALFGDPRSGGAGASDAGDFADATASRGDSLAPLPASRLEVESIAELLGPRAHAFVGGDATEGAARTAGDGVRYLHFATHALLDERFPLDSALVLSPAAEGDPEGFNGLLQAWEIFESVRVDADLVTLSACRSGLGRELPGEGIQGLTRAFLFAGAPSVVAASWRVSDRSTAALMTRFYARLNAGESKDHALRAAQLDLARGPVTLPAAPAGPGWLWGPLRRLMPAPPPERVDATHPYHWAGFQLTGRWR